MVFWIIFGLLIFLLLWFLLAPMYLYISTPEKRYEAGLVGIARFRLVFPGDRMPEIRGRIAFYPFSIPIFTVKEKKQKRKKKKSKKGKRSFSFSRIKFIARLGWKVIRSFKLKQLYLNIDTGDVIRNAYLVPAFSVNFKQNIRLSVNFKNTNELIIHYENNLASIIKNIIITSFNHLIKR